MMERSKSFCYLPFDEIMEAIRLPKVKICCIQTIAEARLAIAAGADWIGLVSEMPSGPGVIPDDRIKQIAGAVRGETTTVLLTSRREADGIIEQARASGTDALQLVDEVSEEELRRVRRALPGVRMLQVVHVLGEESIERASAVAQLVDGVLLDSGDPRRAMKELGGTGRVHDWSLSRRIREALTVPVVLAGGLTPANARKAIALVRPYGLDVCSGVRTNALLDPVKLRAFMHAVQTAS
jgi:phosphoribosylanthranilate isomerase